MGSFALNHDPKNYNLLLPDVPDGANKKIGLGILPNSLAQYIFQSLWAAMLISMIPVVRPTAPPTRSLAVQQ